MTKKVYEVQMRSESTLQLQDKNGNDQEMMMDQIMSNHHYNQKNMMKLNGVDGPMSGESLDGENLTKIPIDPSSIGMNGLSTPPATSGQQVNGGSQDGEQRQQWGKGLEFLVSLASMSVGLGNIWRFPYAAYKNGGGAFLIPYLTILLVVGRPLFYMEMALGQFSSRGVIKIWKICPAFKGIGVAQLISSSYIIIFYNYLMALTLYYLFASFTFPLPWTQCDPAWAVNCSSDHNITQPNPLDLITSTTPNSLTSRLEDAFSTDLPFESSTEVPSLAAAAYAGLVSRTETSTDSDIDVTSASDVSSFGPNSTSISSYSGGPSLTEQYWTKHVLRQSAGLWEITWLNWRLTGCLILSWGIVFLCLIKGVASVGKIAYFTAIFPYVVLFTLLGVALKAEGAVDGIIYLFKPQWARLLDVEVWYNALEQAFFSLGICFGAILNYSSYSNFRNNVNRDALLIAFLDTGTSILAGSAIFAVLGAMAFQSGRDVKDVVDAQGMGLAFIVYPDALSRFSYGPQFLSVAFFFMLYTLGLGSSMGMVEAIFSTIKDQFAGARRNSSMVAFYGCVAFCLMGIPLCTDAGQYMMQLLDNYGGGTAAFLYGIFTLIAVMYIYGLRRFCDDIEFMLGQSVNIFWKFTWGFAAPITLIFIFAYGNYKIFASDNPGGNPGIPSWGLGIGWAFAALALIQIPLWCCVTIYRKQGYSLLDKISDSFRAEPNYGPIDPKIYREWQEYKAQKMRERAGIPSPLPTTVHYSHPYNVSHDQIIIAANDKKLKQYIIPNGMENGAKYNYGFNDFPNVGKPV